MTATIACFGEILLRITAPGREAMLQRPHLDVHVGGAEANVAVGLANLGHQVRMISRLPDNPLGRAATGELRRYGVDLSGVSTGDGRMGLYFLTPGAGLRPSQIFYDRQGSAFASATAANFDWDALFEGVDLLHLSGITPALGRASAELALAAVEAAVSRKMTISFDGNYRSLLWDAWDGDARAILTGLVERADILFGNHRDISLLLGRSFDGAGADRRREAAEAAFGAFPKLRLIASTARALEDSDRQSISARVDSPDDSTQTDDIMLSGIVDRIGTGDAFAAGVLHAMRSGGDLNAMADSGLALACLKHFTPGDFSLSTAQDLAAFSSTGADVRR